MLDRLPPSLQQMLVLEWLSPETVWTLVRASGVLRRCVLSSPQAFRAAEQEVLTGNCVRWFRDRGVPLRPWTTLTTEWSGDVWYHSNGVRHRDDDLPACVTKFGTQIWYKHDRLHRDGDLPAAVFTNGTQVWYQNGKCHRDGGKPALIRPDGTQEWWVHGFQFYKPLPTTPTTTPTTTTNE